MITKPSRFLTLLPSMALLCGVQVMAAEPATSRLSAAASTAALTVAPGLTATLWAAEPLLTNPTNMDIDAKGRIWVCEGLNYRQWHNLRPAGDRIMVLADKDGDGVAETSTVFYQGPDVNAALGICALGDQVLISCSPNVFRMSIIETPDGPKLGTKELLFTGIGGVNHDHGMHAFQFGPDGKLYFNFGNKGGQLHDRADQPIVDLAGNVVASDGHPYRQGQVFRCNPDGSQVETLGYNFRNNYEVTVDSFGTMWQSDNDDDGNRAVRINYVMDHGNYGYTDELTGAGWSSPRDNLETEIPRRHWHQNDPGVIPNLLLTGSGSPCGIVVNEGNLLPGFTNQMIHAEPGANVVRAYPVTNDGAGYTATMVDIVKSHDSWFRPSDVAIAPDGALFICDWFDAGVGGHQMADHQATTAGGRIYRVAPNGHQPVVPPLDLQSPAGCVAALGSPNVATRYLAWTALHALGDRATAALTSVWQGRDPRQRARALHLLARIPGQATTWVTAALADANPDLRITGLRIARELALNPLPLVQSVIKDASAQVRREAALSLRHVRDPGMPALWAALAAQHDGKDRWYLEALGVGADGQEDACFASWLALNPEPLSTAAGRDLVWRSRAAASAPLLARLILDPSATDSRARWFRALDFVPESARIAAASGLLAATGPNANHIALLAAGKLPGTLTDPAAHAAIEALVRRNQGTPDMVNLISRFKLTGHDAELLTFALAHAKESIGLQAFRLVLASSGMSLVTPLLAQAQAEVVVGLLGAASDQQALPALTEIVDQAKQPLALRRAALRAMASLEPGAKILLDDLKNEQWEASLRATANAALAAAPWDWVKIELAKLMPAPQTRDGKTLPGIQQLAKLKGNPPSGKSIYAALCLSCHQVNGDGINFGPDLSEIGTKLGKDALFEAILYPNAGIEFNFETTVITLQDGNTAAGIVVSNTADELKLKMMGGVVTGFAKANITSTTIQQTSAMPSGLQAAMTQDDLVDLVAYLATLRKAK